MSALSRAYEQRDGSEFQVYENVIVEFREASHRYWLHADGERMSVVSVTTGLRVLDKGEWLKRWAEACGAESAVILERQGELNGVSPSEAIRVVRERGLGMEAKRDAGAKRGTSTHGVLEFWGREGKPPSLADFPPEERGYVQGLCKWLVTTRPVVSSVERFVGSLKHGYAGRLDMRATLHGRDCIVDLKTSKTARVYDEAHLQARAYAMADVECGNPPPEGIVIVAVGQDGSFEAVECEAEERDWLAVLACHHALKRVQDARKVRERVARAAA